MPVIIEVVDFVRSSLKKSDCAQALAFKFSQKNMLSILQGVVAEMSKL